MLITVPASVFAAPPITSVLDLEPLLDWLAECRPDAVSLMPPLGADDQPNGAALLAIRDRLEAHGCGVTAGCWDIAPDAPVGDAGWQAAEAFQVRTLISALGEAGVGPLAIRWRASASDPATREALAGFLERVLEEAERSEVPLALRVEAPDGSTGDALPEIKSEWLGACGVLGLPQATPESSLRSPAPVQSPLVAVYAHSPQGMAFDWRSAVAALDRLGFTGPLVVEGCRTPAEAIQGVRLLRSLARPADPFRVSAS